MNLTPVRIHDIGLDWVTLTSKQKNHGILLASAADDLVAEQLTRGAVSHPFTRSGYQGFDVGQVGVGIRPEDCIVRLSADVAQQEWRRFVRLATNCSRIDLQVTAEFELPASRIIASLFKKLKAKSLKCKGGPTLSLWQEVDGDATIYLGKRSSDRFGRIYDKGAESGEAHYQNAVRFEVEVKGNLAWAMWSNLKEKFRQDNPPYPSSDECACIRDCVVDYYNERGVPLAIAIDGLSLLRSGRPRSELLSRLSWLRQSCSSSIEQLCERGFEREVMESLFPDVHVRNKMLDTLRAWSWATGNDTACDSRKDESEVMNVN
jgi:hypothetical protein